MKRFSFSSISCAGFAVATLLGSTLTSQASTIFVSNLGDNTIRSFNLDTGAATPGFATISLNNPHDLAVSGNALYGTNRSGGTLNAYNASTGAALSGFTTITGLSSPTRRH